MSRTTAPQASGFKLRDDWRKYGIKLHHRAASPYAQDFYARDFDAAREWADWYAEGADYELWGPDGSHSTL